jgi:hypothetical protein
MVQEGEAPQAQVVEQQEQDERDEYMDRKPISYPEDISDHMVSLTAMRISLVHVLVSVIESDSGISCVTCMSRHP